MGRRKSRPVAKGGNAGGIAVAKKDSVFSTWSGPDGSWRTLTDILGTTNAPSHVGLYGALHNAAFMLCADIMAQDISKARLRMYRREGDKRVEVKPNEHTVAELLAYRPNEFHTWVDFWEMVVRHHVIAQNAFIAMNVTTRGDLRELIPAIPSRVSILVDDTLSTSERFFDLQRVSNFERMLFRNYPQRLTRYQMIHIPGRMVDGLYGYSTLIAGQGTLHLAKAIMEYQDKLFSSGGRQKVAFTLKEDEELTQEQYSRLQQGFNTLLADDSRPLVLENGADVKTLAMSAKDAEVAIASNAAIVRICQLFRMPPHKAMHIDAVKYENMGSLDRTYVSDTLVPIAAKIEERLRVDLLSKEDAAKYEFEFDRDMMTASDPASRAEEAKIGVQTGAIEIDEARRLMGYDPLPDNKGQVRLVPVNMSVVDRNGEVIQAGAAGAAGDTAEGAQPTDPAQQPANPAKVLQFRQAT